jgi:hypothetical protein
MLRLSRTSVGDPHASFLSLSRVFSYPRSHLGNRSQLKVEMLMQSRPLMELAARINSPLACSCPPQQWMAQEDSGRTP